MTARNLIRPYNVDNTTGVLNTFSGGFLNFTPLETHPNEGWGLFPGSINSNGIAVAGGPMFSEKPITGTLFCAPLKDNQQMRYKEGDILYTIGSQNDIAEGKYVTANLPYLNFKMEERFRINRDEERESLGKKRKSILAPRLFPLTIEEFNENVRFAGIQMTDAPYSQRMEQDLRGSRFKMLAVAHKGRARTANIWDADLKRGDRVGTLVKENPSAFSGFLDTDGQKLDSTTEGKFLQIIPVWFKHGKSPKMCGGVGDPRMEDIMYRVQKTANQRVYASRPLGGGLFNPEEELTETLKLTYEDVSEGRLTEIGQVLHIGQLPSVSSMKMALRSDAEFKKSWGTTYVELEVNPVGDFPLVA